MSMLPKKPQIFPEISAATYLERIIDEHDKQYEQRFRAAEIAVSAALTAQKLAIDTALAAADRAVTKAEVAAEKRFESVNEFRASLADQQRTLMPRSEAEILFRALTEKIDFATQKLIAGEGQKTGMKDVWAYLIGGIGSVVGVVSVILLILFHK